MFCVSGLIFGGTVGVGSGFHVLLTQSHFRRRRSHFHVLRSRTIFDDAEGVVSRFHVLLLDSFSAVRGCRSRFHVLRSRTRFRRYRELRVPFSCFALPDSFSIIPRVSAPVFMFCGPGLIFGGSEGVGSRFSRCQGRWVPFSCFALLDSFSAVPRASAPVFMF
jgi:hypothetical protein